MRETEVVGAGMSAVVSLDGESSDRLKNLPSMKFNARRLCRGSGRSEWLAGFLVLDIHILVHSRFT